MVKAADRKLLEDSRRGAVALRVLRRTTLYIALMAASPEDLEALGTSRERVEDWIRNADRLS